jgi:SnoaL-like protein
LSDDYIDRLRAGYEAFNRDGNFNALLDELDSEVEIVTPPEGPEGANVFRGREGIGHWLREISEGWEEFKYEPLDFAQVDNRVMVTSRVRIKGRSTHLPLEQTMAQVFTFGTNDEVKSMEDFFDLDRARKALDSG